MRSKKPNRTRFQEAWPPPAVPDAAGNVSVPSPHPGLRRSRPSRTRPPSIPFEPARGREAGPERAPWGGVRRGARAPPLTCGRNFLLRHDTVHESTTALQKPEKQTLFSLLEMSGHRMCNQRGEATPFMALAGSVHPIAQTEWNLPDRRKARRLANCGCSYKFYRQPGSPLRSSHVWFTLSATWHLIKLREVRSRGQGSLPGASGPHPLPRTVSSREFTRPQGLAITRVFSHTAVSTDPRMGG